MGKIIVTAWIALDGYVAGPDDEMDWLLFDEDLMRYEQTLVDEASALLFGRQTHSDFANSWPKMAADPDEDPATRAYAQRVCELAKVVVSGSGDVTPWEGTTRLHPLDRPAIEELKARHDGPIVVYGSLSVVGALVSLGAVDEFHLLVHPILLGAGKPLYGERLPLRALATETFSSGVTLSRYAPA